MGQEVLKKFGKYFLLDCIAQGGMAEIFRARLASLDGPGRLVVIKRILAGYGRNLDFQKMFKSEIKVMMGFSHHNIIQLYDFGEYSAQPFIAMEFVDGKNLRQFISKFQEQKKTMPIELAVYIIEQVAAGLQYAHAFKDKLTGEPLNIIHRDISPQNILVSYDGAVKVIDFGIAKADTNGESTRVGIIKGKPSYLAPEQITGLKLDYRCDIFSLGTVLWEVLAGRKLFAAPKGENEFSVLKLIESCESYVKAPSTVNPDVPKELDYIVLKALVKNRDKRYQRAEELQRALHKFLYSYCPDFNPADLSHYAKTLFKDAIVQDRKTLMKLNSQAEHLLEGQEDILAQIPDVQRKKEQPKDGTKTFVDPRKASSSSSEKDATEGYFKSQVVELENGPKTSTSVTQDTHTGTGKSGSIASPGTLSHPRASFPSRARIPHQTKGVGEGFSVHPGFTKMIAALAVVAIGVFGAMKLLSNRSVDVKDQQNRTTAQSTQAHPTQTTQTEKVDEKVKGENIRLKLLLPDGLGETKITINGQRIDPENPETIVPLNKALELIVTRTGFKTFKREFVLDSFDLRGQEETEMNIPLSPVKFGYLTIYTIPSADAKISNSESRSLASGKKFWVLRTPIETEKIPIGTYTIKLENRVLGMEKTVLVKVKEGKTVKLNERLEIKP